MFFELVMAQFDTSFAGGDAGGIHPQEEEESGQLHNNTDAQKWLEQIKQRCDPQYNPQNSIKRDGSICRLPASLKRYKKLPYDPQIVGLGLFNHNVGLPLSPVEENKVEAVRRTLKRLKKKDKSKKIEDLVGPIRELHIRECYDEEAATKGDDEQVLAWRFVMDGCFILQFLQFGVSSGVQQWWDILCDIFKLENQIPLRVLVNILQLEYGTTEEAENKLACMLYMHKPFQEIPFSLKSKAADVEKEIGSAHHLLDLVHRMVVRFLTKSSMETESDSSSSTPHSPEDHDEFLEGDSEYHLQSAENLQKNGIKLKASKKGEVKFQKKWLGQSILFLPKIYVGHDTEGLIRNLMAVDSGKSIGKMKKEWAIICQLMVLMDCLIETRNDIAILRKERILCSRIGSDKDLAVMFNNLCIGGRDRFPYYEEEVRKVKEHCGKKLNKDQWISWYKEYFTKPWHVISLLAAAILLSFAAFQSYHTAQGYFRN